LAPGSASLQPLGSRDDPSVKARVDPIDCLQATLW